MKARQILDRKKLCFDSMHVIGYRDVGVGDFKPHVEEIMFVARVGVSSNAVFSKQTFVRNSVTKNVKTQSICVL